MQQEYSDIRVDIQYYNDTIHALYSQDSAQTLVFLKKPNQMNHPLVSHNILWLRDKDNDNQILQQILYYSYFNVKKLLKQLQQSLAANPAKSYVILAQAKFTKQIFDNLSQFIKYNIRQMITIDQFNLQRQLNENSLQNSSKTISQTLMKLDQLSNQVLLPNFLHFADQGKDIVIQRQAIQVMLKQKTNRKLIIQSLCQLAKLYYPVAEVESLHNIYKQNSYNLPDFQLLNMYTDNTFVHKIVNNLLRVSFDSLQLLYIQVLVVDLCNSITNLYYMQKQKRTKQELKCYRGAKLNQHELQIFTKSKGDYVQCLSFLSTSTSKDTALQFQHNTLITITIHNLQLINEKQEFGFAFMQEHSKHKYEQEILFNIISLFRVNKVVQTSQCCQIQLQFVSRLALLKQINNGTVPRKYRQLCLKKKKMKCQADLLIQLGSQMQLSWLYWRKTIQIIQKQMQSTICKNYIILKQKELVQSLNSLAKAYNYYHQEQIYQIRKKLKHLYKQIMKTISLNQQPELFFLIIQNDIQTAFYFYGIGQLKKAQNICLQYIQIMRDIGLCELVTLLSIAQLCKLVGFYKQATQTFNKLLQLLYSYSFACQVQDLVENCKLNIIMLENQNFNYMDLMRLQAQLFRKVTVFDSDYYYRDVIILNYMFRQQQLQKAYIFANQLIQQMNKRKKYLDFWMAAYVELLYIKAKMLQKMGNTNQFKQVLDQAYQNYFTGMFFLDDRCIQIFAIITMIKYQQFDQKIEAHEYFASKISKLLKIGHKQQSILVCTICAILAYVKWYQGRVNSMMQIYLKFLTNWKWKIPFFFLQVLLKVIISNIYFKRQNNFIDINICLRILRKISIGFNKIQKIDMQCFDDIFLIMLRLFRYLANLQLWRQFWMIFHLISKFRMRIKKTMAPQQTKRLDNNFNGIINYLKLKLSQL